MTAAANRKQTAERSVTITRVINAPRHKVFKAWIDAEQLARWWGPHHFTNPLCEIDVRPGGKILIHMRALDGTVYPMSGTFREIVEPSRIVFVAVAEDANGNAHLESLTTVTFEDHDGNTKLTVTADATGFSPAVPQMLAGMDAGWSQSLEKLNHNLTGENMTETADCPMMATPQKEHEWLAQLVGEWTVDSECIMAPDQPPMKGTGTCSTRSLGGLWFLSEGSGEMPNGGTMNSIITLGYDPQKGRYVGSFIASMMTHLWLYEGTRDASGKVLTLDAEGPSMAGDGTMASYQDIVTIESKDHWVLSSQIKGPDGQWIKFMTAHHRRKK